MAASDGTTALVVATIRGHTALVRYLLNRDADANAGPGFAPLHWAVGEWNTGLTSGRRDEGSEWSVFKGLKGEAKLELVQLLLAYGANPNLRATASPRYEGGGQGAGGPLSGATPFLIAAKAADLDVMRALLASGADPSVATDRKTTPLMAAAGVGSGTGSSTAPESRALEAVRLCREVGNDPRAANVEGETALHGAAYRGPQGADTLIQFLVDKGADVNVKNQRGWTPLAIVEGLYFLGTNTRSPSAIELLQKLGADPTRPGLDRNVGGTTTPNR